MPSLEVGFSESSVSARRLEYFNAITLVDQQIGRLLDTLESSGVADNTAVLFLGDHGWQLAEHSSEIPICPAWRMIFVTQPCMTKHSARAPHHTWCAVPLTTSCSITARF